MNEKKNPSEWLKVKLDKKHLLVAITGHGFGHAVRVMQVLNRIAEKESLTRFTIITPVVDWFLQSTANFDYRLISLRLDIGAIQTDATNVNPLETLKAYSEFILNRDSILKQMETHLANDPVDAVLYDIPPIGSEIGNWLGVPTVGITNFSWDWIYEEYTKLYPEYQWVVEEIRHQYALTDLLLSLPYNGDLSAFPKTQEISWICRKSEVEPIEVKQKLNIDPMKPVALVTFGGIGSTVKLPLGKWTKEVQFLVSTPLHQLIGEGTLIENETLKQLGLTFTDLIQAASFVVSKPGYGIVSECIAHQTPMLYLERSYFREYGSLLEALNRHLHSQVLSEGMIESGNWQSALEELFAKRSAPPEPDPIMDGDYESADILLNLMNS